MPMAEPGVQAGSKRRYSSSSPSSPVKKRRVHHRVQHVQNKPPNTEPAPQKPVFTQGQLLRSLSAALVLAGFDSVEPSALEMFRSHTESYMLKLLSYVRETMQGGRRQRPTASDFTLALSMMPNAQTASLLKPQLSLAIPENVSYPSIAEPASDEAPAPDLSRLLAPLLDTPRPVYIPKHFPSLPPRHAWMETPVFAQRETDPKQMREKCTQEGMMAEQALRKLAAAAKAGAMKVEEKKKKSHALSGPGKTRFAATRKGPTIEETFASVLQDLDSLPGDGDGHDNERGINGDEALEHVVVNYEMGQWRHGGGRRALRL